MVKKHDVIIVGGGIMASSLAYHLLRDGFTGEVTIFEKDPQYEYSSTPRSEGGIRQTFSTEINIRMSQYSFQVYKNFEADMAINGERAVIDFKQHGYLYLLNEKTLPMYKEIMRIQQKLGVNARLIEKGEINEYIPELNVEDLAGAVFDPDAGNLDPYSVLQAYVRKAKQIGASYIFEEVDCLLADGGQISGIQLKSGEKHLAPIVVNASGAWSGEFSQTIGLDLPVRPLRRQIFCLDTAKPFSKELPFTFDPTGIHFRSEGRKIIVGWGHDAPYGYDFHWERSYFEEQIWPILAGRSSNFEQLKLERGWAGLYDYNTIDQNAIIGGHPKMKGYYIVTGFSGHGFQHAPAAGNGLSELIRLGRFETIDLSALSVERFEKNELVLETAIF